MPTIVLFDTKPYDREFMASAAGAGSVEWVFHEFRLGAPLDVTGEQDRVVPHLHMQHA